ncbi:HD domain-containing protein [Micromonospora endolithica]|uniref:HD domain-containing protein n=1 Tax=Micromonospora endolithica TaxID=230091 RepID=A0A3A9YPS6_9ACTN|nr:HD domain-containing protein [Micromonospora endolithica]
MPTDGEIRTLHETYAPSQDAFDLVHTHCQIVWRIAEQLLHERDHDLDTDLVRAGCLLHDIGVYLLYGPSGVLDHGNYVQHGVLGHQLLIEQGVPERIRRFCSHHTGMGLSREDVLRQGLPIPVDDYLAETDEERLVMYADKFHSKTNPPVFLTATTYRGRVRRFGEDKVTRFDALVEKFGEPRLDPLAAEYGQRVS